VERVPRPQEDRMRAPPERLRTRHRRVDPELARLVVRGRDDAATARIADDERLRPQLRLLELLDGREERVQIKVGDDHGPPPSELIGIPSRAATNGTVAPWTRTENVTSTKTIP